MVNIIWMVLILVGIMYSILTKQNITETILTSPAEAFKITLEIFPNLALWLGIMNIAKKSGLIDKISKILSKPLKILFKDIPENDESLGYISSNIAVNMLGVGNAATPIGLKAMKSLKKLTKNDRASKSMITFLVLNTSGLTLIPTTILSMRNLYNSSSPSKIILPCIIVTLLSTIISLIIDAIFRKVTRD